ncbi:DUF2784 domain-containing protein [Solihabitans fulvus]|uniref:DUF2784 domain-containing protein n=1 Tax=Solihabitans fulvus TaxID=1892852 RepID=A0A5B2WDK7_9PSEU|nr:DUF2784 domain-containing protein [Solihabitans fulvus]KAA2248447.1 DUF2784 domain-containing protein [Solihabitans fulvus]
MVAQMMVVLVVILHFAALAFVLFGGFVAWRWRWVFYLHLMFAAWAIIIITFPAVDCPLTLLENVFRHAAGMPELPGFIDHYVTGVLYPDGYKALVQGFVVVLILTSWLGLYARRRGERRAGAHRMGIG